MTDDLYLRYRAVSLYKDTADRLAPLAALITAEDTESRLTAAAEVFRAVAAAHASSTGEWIASLVIADDNPYSRAVARGERVTDAVKACVENELTTFKQLSLVRCEKYFDAATLKYAPKFCCGGFDLTAAGLAEHYTSHGCGVLASGDAFVYGDDGFTPVATGGVRLDDLKNYAEEKSEVIKNTENFIAGLPAFHTLLYGDRGTGKSTTVRALCNEYRGRLKLVELPGGRLDLLPRLMTTLSGLKQKFIVFIDDLSFDEKDPRADGFKAALEGSLDTGEHSALIYCTSNRRHLFKETDKTDARHRSDEVQAELALFDRFGLVVTYIDPDKAEFLDIFRQILKSRGIKWRDEYEQIAELAALKKGGRTPRTAKQIADVIEATIAEAAHSATRQ